MMRFGRDFDRDEDDGGVASSVRMGRSVRSGVSVRRSDDVVRVGIRKGGRRRLSRTSGSSVSVGRPLRSRRNLVVLLVTVSGLRSDRNLMVSLVTVGRLRSDRNVTSPRGSGLSRRRGLRLRRRRGSAVEGNLLPVNRTLRNRVSERRSLGLGLGLGLSGRGTETSPYGCTSSVAARLSGTPGVGTGKSSGIGRRRALSLRSASGRNRASARGVSFRGRRRYASSDS